MSRRLGLGCPLILAPSLCIALPVVAQDRAAGGGGPPPHISFVEGAATLEREGRVARPGRPEGLRYRWIGD